MNGEMNFNDALNQRLSILEINDCNIKNTLQIINNCITKTFIQNKNFIMKNNQNIYIVSGGFHEFINPIAKILGIKSNHIFANSFIKKDENCQLNNKSIMAMDKGKVEIVKSLKLDGTTIVIGDGYTDYEIKKYGYADIFIAYTEHIDRKKVSELSDYKSTSFKDIINYINNL